MANEVYSDKVSVNINTSTLSQIDMLVDGGYYSNRSDFINQAVREKLQAQSDVLARLIRAEEAEVEDNKWFLGVQSLSGDELRKLKDAGRTMTVRGYGLLIIPAAIPEELLYETVECVSVKGRVNCSAAVRAHYGIK